MKPLILLLTIAISAYQEFSLAIIHCARVTFSFCACFTQPALSRAVTRICRCESARFSAGRAGRPRVEVFILRLPQEVARKGPIQLRDAGARAYNPNRMLRGLLRLSKKYTGKKDHGR